MKKIVILIICMILLLTACSGKNEHDTGLNSDNYASFVGAGEMTLIEILVNSNAKFINEVFGTNHLPVDETKTIENSLGVFAPVVSDKYKTLNDLRTQLEATYSTSAIDSILSNPEKYVDIDGKLYFNMKYDEPGYTTDWSQPEISAKIDEDGKYLINIVVKDKNGKDIEIEGCAISENGTLKLEDIYY